MTDIDTSTEGPESIAAWKCPRCTTAFLDPEHARSCCCCYKCGAPLPDASQPGVRRSGQRCEVCASAHRDAELAVMRRLPVDHNHTGPVWLAQADTYHHDIDDAADAAADAGIDPPVFLPCTVKPMRVLDVLECCEEEWCTGLDDYDGPDWSPAVLEAWETLRALLVAEAPDSWIPDRERRVEP